MRMPSNQFLLQIKPYNELFDRLTSPKNNKLILFKHPSNVNMTYGRHMVYSLILFKKLFVSSIKMLIHAFIPDLFITTISDLIVDIRYNLCIENPITPSNSVDSGYASSLPLSPLSIDDIKEEQERKQLEYYSKITKDIAFSNIR